ncbi:MAG: peptidylprolyl isomerase [Planctomycetota bacterium]
MQLRSVAAAFLLLGTPLAAQAQDPDKPQSSPQAQLEELQREKERLQKEIGFARERAAQKQQMLKDKLGRAKPAYRSIDAGANVPPAPVMPAVQPPRLARVATKEEFANQPEGTALLVNGRPVAQRAIDELVAYLASTPGSGDAAMQQQRALFELIRLEAVAASFDEAQAETEDRIGQVLGDLAGGKSAAALVKAVGSVRGADAEGRVEITRNSMFGPLLERAAFGAEPGKPTRPVRTADGIAVVVLQELKKGDQPELDRAVCTVIQAPYTQDPDALGKAQMAVNTGQVDVLVRDEALRERLPAMFLPQAAPAVSQAVVDVVAVEKQMTELSAVIAQLQGRTDDDSKAKLRAAESAYAELKAQLSRGSATVEKPVDVGDVIKEAPVVPPVKKKQ